MVSQPFLNRALAEQSDANSQCKSMVWVTSGVAQPFLNRASAVPQPYLSRFSAVPQPFLYYGKLGLIDSNCLN